MFDARRLFAVFKPRGPVVPPGGAPLREALALLERHEISAALAAFESALAAQSLTATVEAFAENKRGVCLVQLGRPDEAFAAFCRSLQLDEAHAPAYVNVGNCLLEAGALADAVDFYDAAILADPGYAHAYHNLGIAHKRAGRRAEGVRALRTATRLQGRPQRGGVT